MSVRLDQPTSLRLRRDQVRKLDRLSASLRMTRGGLVRQLVDALPTAPPEDAPPKALPWTVQPLEHTAEHR